jgi:ubiquinone/menaquinone biosynthesis C-methylase UbiE
MTAFDALAEDYDASRLGYSHELYDALVAFGLDREHTVLDVGCGTGLASAPLVENAFRVTGVDASKPMLDQARSRLPGATWVEGRAEALPFGDAGFDAVISAQAFHHFDVPRAIAEVARVVRPRGVVAIWWKHLMNEDPVKRLRDEVVRELRKEPPASGLNRGFKEFYGTFSDTALRVIPWRTGMTLGRWMQYERSRSNIRAALGGGVEQYFTKLETRLRAHFGEGDPFVPLGYIQFLYLAKR